MLRIGTAGWAISRGQAGQFPPGGTQLARYSGRFCAVEVNSTFYRPHRATTYAKWAASVPAEFRFALKLPRAITHESHLVGAEPVIAAFLDESAGLGAKRGPLLVQLPPRFDFDAAIAEKFFATLRRVFSGICAPEIWCIFDNTAAGAALENALDLLQRIGG